MRKILIAAAAAALLSASPAKAIGPNEIAGFWIGGLFVQVWDHVIRGCEGGLVDTCAWVAERDANPPEYHAGLRVYPHADDTLWGVDYDFDS